MSRKILLLFLFPLFLWSQNDSIFKGRIVSESDFLDEIHIVNVSEDIGVVSERGGYFKIKAKVNDTLMFSAVYLKGYQRVVIASDFAKDLVLIPMEAIVNQLSEVTLIEYKNINPESLGIVPKGQKRYTPAERKLMAAGGFGLHSLLNAISGRTKMLEKELVVEKKEMLQEKTIDVFQKEYIVNTLKIPEDYVEGFLFYVVEDDRYIAVMKDDDKAMAIFILGQLASEYIALKELNKKEGK